jgi:hypothetical protein
MVKDDFPFFVCLEMIGLAFINIRKVEGGVYKRIPAGVTHAYHMFDKSRSFI